MNSLLSRPCFCLPFAFSDPKGNGSYHEATALMKLMENASIVCQWFNPQAASLLMVACPISSRAHTLYVLL